MKLVRKVNDEGIWQEDVIIQSNESIPKDCVDIYYEGGLILPKVENDKWVEGADLILIEEQRRLELLKPLQSDIDKAKRELEIIELLSQLGMV